MVPSPAPADLAPRSAASRDFEWLWHALRAGRAMPDRSDLTLSNARNFVRDLVLTEFDGEHLAIRIAGQRFQDIARCQMAGRDLLDFMFAEYRDGALQTSRLMAQMPCGLWQITPMHLASGYAQPIEVTGFPFAQDGKPALLFLVLALDGVLPSTLSGPKTMALDTALQFEFLDVGAGIPQWPSTAANAA